VTIAQSFAERPFDMRVLLIVFLAAVCANHTYAQNVVEAAGATSVSAATTSSAKAPSIPAMPSNAAPTVSPHLTASSAPPPEETNRIFLSQNAGKDASKILLRSTLPESRIWINGKPVGKVPMLLVVPPGKYQIEVVGPHAERTQSVVALLPGETRDLMLKLEPRYRARVTLH
jgi:PEGA domain